VISMYQWQKVKENRLKGMSIKGLSRKFNLSKNTIRKYLRTEAVPSMKKRTYLNCVEPFKTEVADMLKKGLIGSRIFKELKAKGFQRSQSSVDRYLRKVRSSERVEKQTSRFETEPGQQMQYDWKEWELEIGGISTKLYIHSLILSYSRKKFYVASLGITTADILQAIYAGMAYFGGFSRELVIDNPKQMVLTHRKNGLLRYNDGFLKFCGLFGIIPNACENYRPQTKGKVERPFLYLQEHFLKGLEVQNWGCFEAKLATFTDSVNTNYHRGIETTPNNRFEIEKTFLQTIPQVEPSSWRLTEIRKVSQDGYLSLMGKLYPVPMRLCGKEVMVESLFGKTFKVMWAEAVVCELSRRFDGPNLVSHPEHAAMNSDYEAARQKKRGLPVREFIRLFPAQGALFFEGLKTVQRENAYYHVAEILKLTQFYHLTDMAAVLEECMALKAFHKNTVKRLLVSKPLKATPVSAVVSALAVARPSTPISRPLSVYKELTHV